jgi:hypothetical protein
MWRAQPSPRKFMPATALSMPPAPYVRFAVVEEFVVSVLALAVVAVVVALAASNAFGVGRALEIGGTPIVNTEAAGIQLLPCAAHGDALAVLVVVSGFARLAHEVANIYFLVRASTIAQGSRASRLRNQLARALEAAGHTHSVVEVEVSLARLTHVVADRDLMGRACAVAFAGGTGLCWDQLARALEAAGHTHSVVEVEVSLARLTHVVANIYPLGRTRAVAFAGGTGLCWDQLTRALEAFSFACDGQLRANVRAQVGHTRSCGAGGLNGDV